VLDRVICSDRSTPALFHKHLPLEIRSVVIRQQAGSANAPEQPEKTPAQRSMPVDQPLESWQDFRKTAQEAAEKDYFERLLAVTGGDIGQMVKIADMSKSRIYGLISKHDLTAKK
jgi:two-component system NtrC family response regulator